MSANEGNYEVSVDGSVTFDDSKLQEEYDNLAANVESLEQQIEVHVSTDTDEAGLDGMNESLEETLSLIEKVSSTGITIQGITTSVDNLNKITTASNTAAGSISALSQQIANMPSAKTTTITTRYVSEYSSVYSGGKVPNLASGAILLKAQPVCLAQLARKARISSPAIGSSRGLNWLSPESLVPKWSFAVMSGSLLARVALNLISSKKVILFSIISKLKISCIVVPHSDAAKHG